jgi:hypothetical protein
MFFPCMYRILLVCAWLTAATQAAEQKLDKPTLAWMQAALNNWELICRRDLRIGAEPLPWIIFYDESHAWHLKPEKRWLPVYEVSAHSLQFAGRSYPLIRVPHVNGRLWVPDREAIPIGLARPRAVAMPYQQERKFFFIAPLPALFHKLAGPDQVHKLDEIFLGVVAHELTHTRHFVYAMPKIKSLRSRYKLPASFDDNTIEREFGANDEYKHLYEEEGEHLTKAILASDLDECLQSVAQASLVSRKRKERFFVGDKEGYSELEDVFLAMEGLAMWVQYRTARDRAPAGEEWLATLSTLSETHDAWSQEEGLGLFLLIDRLVPGWQRRFLAADFPSPFTVLRDAIERRGRLKSPAKHGHAAGAGARIPDPGLTPPTRR